jgi:type III pantothenate kinase
MNLIAVDAGNSFWKIGVFNKGELVLIERKSRSEDCSHIINELAEEYSISQTIISSVRNQNTKAELESNINANCFWVSVGDVWPFENKYSTPQSLGIDRLIACAGAYDGNDLLLIDVGSCITYDIVIDEKYLGGAISPGIHLRMKSMHQFTDNLPNLSVPKNPVEFIGDSTQSCMESGVMNGVLLEIQGFISEIQIRYPKINVYLTGGDANIFAEGLKSSIFVRPNIVLEGLYKIYQLNAQ